MTNLSALAKRIDSLDFDTVFEIVDGEVIVHESEHAPSVYGDDDCDVVIDDTSWECLTGFTNQYGYSGAVMHTSEWVGTGIAEYLAECAVESPGMLFAIVVVSVPDNPEDLAGWAIAYREPVTSDVRYVPGART